MAETASHATVHALPVRVLHLIALNAAARFFSLKAPAFRIIAVSSLTAPMAHSASTAVLTAAFWWAIAAVRPAAFHAPPATSLR